VLERYYQELLNFCARTARSRDAAADLVQESYARVLAVQRSGQPVPEPRALLYRTVRNLQIDQYRRSEVRGEADADEAAMALDELAAPPAFEPDTAAASGQAVSAMLATIDALPLRCREAFILHKFDGLPHAEVAERMGISRKMVEQHIQLAMQACRRCKNAFDGTA
jgi:RNA polymerase sigma factor (sigma-70 family)